MQLQSSPIRGVRVAIKVLITDDEPDLEMLLRQYFRRELQQGVYDFRFALNGAEALEILRADPSIEILLTDINMPVMDGLTLLGHVSELDRPIQTVVISAYGDMANIRTAMNRGAFDFLTKPIDFADLQATLDKTVRRAEAERRNREDRDRLTLLDSELSIASRIQQSFLPQRAPQTQQVELAAIMRPARHVGGDFYDYFTLNDHSLALALGDVSGKGIPAALFMATTRTLLKAVAHRTAQPGQALTQVNAMLRQENRELMFATLFFGLLNPQTGELAYANASHLPPLLVSANGSISEIPKSGNLMLGAISGHTYRTLQTTMPPESKLIVFSDGITEARNHAGDLFGSQRLREIVSELGPSNAQATLDHIIAAVEAFTRGRVQADDWTLLVARRV
jgi:sigma-B regulation protein RsbU (phosphoserine phosphatase)